MIFICDFCKREYDIPQRHEVYARLGKSFCNIKCLQRYVNSMNKLSWENEIFEKIEKCPMLTTDTNGTSKYSTYFNKYFRSQYEIDFAELIVRRWSWKVNYEEHSVPLNQKKYVPDFFIPKHTVWLEVKGTFFGHIGAMEKFKVALDILGEDRLILVGPQYYTEVCKAVQQLRGINNV